MVRIKFPKYYSFLQFQKNNRQRQGKGHPEKKLPNKQH
ncbi:DUF4023 family protein [Halalkalibacter alkaliphilus]